jgi:hypothetical protein
VPDQPANKFPFWIHQIVEYGIGGLLVFQAVQSPRPVFPLLAGLLVILLAATADGPAGCFRFVPRPLHRILDLVVAIALIAGAVVFGDEMGGAGQILLVAGALALAFLSLRSDYRPKAARRGQFRAEAAESGSDRAEAIGRGAGRLAARGVQEYRKRRPGPKGT